MVVLKLGGSLLTLPDVASRVGGVIARRPHEHCALVVGGGNAADLVREWDRAHQLGDEAAHRLALAAMRLTAEFIALRLPASRIAADQRALAAAWAARELPLLAAEAWLARAESAGRTTVPHTWHATSDTIAAWLAAELGAQELILLKSVPCPAGELQRAADDGLVDPCFPGAAARVPQISWVNLRSDECRIQEWLPAKEGS